MPLFLFLSLAVAGAAIDGSPTEPAFREVAAAVGLDFRHFNGMSGKLYFAEHMGGAVALFDYDNDGDLDIYLGQGNLLDATPPAETTFPPAHPLPLGDRIYRNDLEIDPSGEHRLRFTDVTQASGVRAQGYSMGVAVADYDGDGFLDLYILNLGANQLWRNLGDGTFEDVTARAGVDDRRWSVAASFFDYDGDGFLDLYVGNYVSFRVATHKNCASPIGNYDYCGPKAYPPEPNRLLHNLGDGTFEDVTEPSGMAAKSGATLGTVAADFNGDGRIDLYVANDQMENEMWMNQGDGTFIDEALLSGTAVDGLGQPQASMGLVAGDLNQDGHVDLFISHLGREMNTLYLNDGQGLFTDTTRDSGLGRPSWEFTGFGTVLFDYDGDAVPDLFVANGEVRRVEAQLRAGEPHPLRQANQLFRGLGGGRFAEVEGGAREEPIYFEVSRGAAVGDLDNDGDADLVIGNNAGPVRLLLNQRRPRDDWIGLRLVSSDGKRDLLGARVALLSADGAKRWQQVRSDGSYAGASDPRVRFALRPSETRPDGGGPGVVRIQVLWPGGERELFPDVLIGRYVTLHRGTGTVVDSDLDP